MTSRYGRRIVIDTADAFIPGHQGGEAVQYPANLLKGANSRFPRVAVFGDSITSPINSYGYWMWMRFFLRHRIYLPESHNFGVAGNTTAQMIERLDGVLAVQPDIVVFLGGTNDISGGSSAATLDNYRVIFSRILQSGAQIVVVPVLPRVGGQMWGVSGLNSFLFQYCLMTPGMFYVSGLSGMLTDSTGALLPNYYQADGLHPAPAGACEIGRAIAKTMAVLIDPIETALDYVVQDQWHGSYAPYGNLLANPSLTGTGGSVGAPSTGAVATGWGHSGGGGGGGVTGSLVLSQQAAQDSSGDWQVMTLTNRGFANASDSHSLSQSVPYSLGKYAAGDSVVASIEVDVSDNVGLYGFTLNMTEQAGSGTTNAVKRDLRITSFAQLGSTKAMTGLLKTEPLVIRQPSGSGVQQLDFNFTYVPNGTYPGGANMTIKVRRPSLRKVVTA